MSRIDKLIAELSPDGVEYVKIKDVYQRLRGTPITAEKMKEIEKSGGKIKIFAGGKTVITAYEKDIPNANVIRVPAVLVQSRGVIDAIYYEQPFTFKNEMWAYTAENKISVKYLYYVLKNNIQYFRDAASGMGSLPQISLKVTEDFRIPIPPLPIQEEIVRILDAFTTLEAELEAELEARKKQYEYYRDELLSFGDDVEWKILGEVFDVRDGTHDTPKQALVGYYLVTSKNIKNGGIDYSSSYLVSKEDFNNINKRSRVDRWDVLIGMIGTVGEVAIVTENEKFAIKNVGLIKTGNEMKSKFVFHYLTCSSAKKYISENVSKGSQAFLGLGKLRDFPIPIPPLAEQARIVEILDRFDALTNDITVGLPAEIAARRKQYEYYRDKLLSFKEKVS